LHQAINRSSESVSCVCQKSFFFFVYFIFFLSECTNDVMKFFWEHVATICFTFTFTYFFTVLWRIWFFFQSSDNHGFRWGMYEIKPESHYKSVLYSLMIWPPLPLLLPYCCCHCYHCLHCCRQLTRFLIKQSVTVSYSPHLSACLLNVSESYCELTST
jgi:hypothetical protein